MPTLREFQSRRPNRILYETITFYNPVFGYVRLVNNQIFPKTLGGQVYTPCRMELTESQQSNTPILDSTVKFSRLAQDFKQSLKQWKAYARITPISATYQQFDAADMGTALKTWTLYVSDCSMDDQDVTCSLTKVNPLNRNVGRLYTVEEFPGLQNA
ncbi:hypothetical protein ACI49Z_003719 [Cronobacter turicensis]|nr:hypothetical protein [Cronobacter turicensis]ELQ6074619.1 hypothetical protein [Cronobacter turicensis]ELQ6183795.1 hypothetical protein [Cronobacter turicensis]ELQ6234741.1 hypothetical protein [Cronobacter turicensis]ELQ6238621.1 hypothetical protein [Cronobacter turicensis]